MDDISELRQSGQARALIGYLKQARDRLIQTGTRNRLVHTSRGKKRGKSVDVVDERSDEVFRILVVNGKRMRFDHDPQQEDEDIGDEPRLPSPGKTGKGDERFTDNLLQTEFSQDKLQKKLLGLAREAKTLEEEQGINALYLALGFLKWFEDEKSETPREAPLVLVPVSLRRNDRSSTYELEAGGEDITTNEPLKRRLEDDFGIKLPEIDERDGWLPSEYFAAVNECISGRARWEIDADGIQLGFFSFAKLLMVRDLEPENWPGSSLMDSPLVAGLLAEGFDEGPDEFSDVEQLDEVFAPADIIQVVDADASQTLVIEAVRRGRNLVVKGPPGTGKSQTITNIIASAAHDGKTVLFMAEKMAALNVVHSRLVKAGLKDLCLELHSRSANKRVVAEEIGRTLGAPATYRASDGQEQELQSLRDKLNRLSQSMHQPIGETDITPYRALSTLVRLTEQRFKPTDVTITGVENWTRRDLDDALGAARLLAEISERAGAKEDHPFFGVGRAGLLPTDIERLRSAIGNMMPSLLDVQGKAADLASNFRLTDQPTFHVASEISRILRHTATLSDKSARFALAVAGQDQTGRLKKFAETGLTMVEATEGSQAVFRPAALAAQVGHLAPMLASGYSFLGRLGSKYRAASTELGSMLLKPLPKEPSARVNLLNHLVEWQQSVHQFDEQKEFGAAALGDTWQDYDTDFSELRSAIYWIEGLKEITPGADVSRVVQMRLRDSEALETVGSAFATNAGKSADEVTNVFETLDLNLEAAFGVKRVEDIPLELLVTKLQAWQGNFDRLDEWVHLSSAHEQMQRRVGADLADAIADGSIPPGDIVRTIRYVHAETLYREFAGRNPDVIQLTAQQKAQLVGSFQDREKRRFGTVSQIIKGQHLNAMPRGGMGGMGFIRGEIARKRGHKPIRKVMATAGSVVQQIKPILLMSPISVAQYLPPGTLEFDLLVIDEASQVRPEDAIGAIARAKQVVVVGDRQQLPPTSFFDRLVADAVDDEDVDEDVGEVAAPPATSAVELESILTLCEARGLKTRMLQWHYRSRHPSLIEVSNQHFYEGRLVLFPSPNTRMESEGLKLRRVSGAYDRGGKRHNAIEAREIAGAVATHAKASPERSLGVVTFSTSQKDQVTYWLDNLRQEDEALDVFMREGRDEEFFVKNIENVQGDERDVILISVCYGPRLAGQRLDNMGFGPVSSEGGARRLNVLFTRARFKTEVFVSFNPGDIDLSRTSKEGARVLKHFLQAAETGLAQQPTPLGDDPDSDFEVSVADAIRSLGYAVDYQVGSGGFKIDLAVRDPDIEGKYLLAVECDGATYHSALWARERDRQRQEVLESLGWRFHRVWSTDWFHRRNDEFRRLEQAIEDARKVPASEPATSTLTDEVEEPVEVAQELLHTPAPDVPDLPDYEIAEFAVVAREEPHHVPVGQMAEIVGRIVDIEGPVHQEEVARRVASLFGKQKAGSRIVDRVLAGLRFMKSRRQDIETQLDFWFTQKQRDAVPLRNRSRAPSNLRRAKLIPPIEIEEAIRHVLADNGALPEDEIPRAVALLFGFQRTGQEFRPAVEPVVQEMARADKIVETEAGFTIVA